MVRKLLIKKGWGMILSGLILFFVVGPIAFVFLQGRIPVSISRPTFSRSALEWFEIIHRMSVGSGIGAIGIFFIMFGTMYFLATTILEYMKKRRLTHKSVTC